MFRFVSEKSPLRPIIGFVRNNTLYDEIHVYYTFFNADLIFPDSYIPCSICFYIHNVYVHVLFILHCVDGYLF